MATQSGLCGYVRASDEFMNICGIGLGAVIISQRWPFARAKKSPA